MTDSYLLPPLPFQDKYKIYYYYEDGEVCTADPELVKQLEKEKSLETVDEQPKNKQTEYEEHNNNGLKKSTSHPFKYLRNRGNNHRKTVSENPTFFKPSTSPLTTSSPSPSSSSSSNASPTTSLSIPQSQFGQSSSYKTTANDLPQSTSIHHHKHTFSTPAAIHNASTMKRGRSKSFYQFFTGGVSNDLPEDSEQQPQTPRVKFATFRHPKEEEEEEQAEDESEEDDEEEEEEFEEEIDYQQENANQSLQQTTTKSAKKNKLKKSLKKKINKISLSGDSNKKLAGDSNKKNFTSYRYDDVQSREEPITKLSPEQQAIEDQRMKNQLLHIEKLLEKQNHQKTLNSSNITNRNSEITENSSLDSLPSSTTWATSVSSSSPPPSSSSNKQEESFHFKQQRSLSLSAQAAAAAAAATPRRNSHRRVPSQTHQEIQAQLQQIQEVYGSDQTKTYNTPASAAATARRVSIGNGNCYAFSEPHHNLSQESIIYNNQQQQQQHPIFAPEYSMTNTLKSNNDKLNLCSPRTETPPNFSFNTSSSKHHQQQSNKFGKFLFRKENAKEENNNNNGSSGSGYFGSQNETLQPQFSYQSNKDSFSLPSPTNVSPGSLHTANFASINAFPSPRTHGSNSSGSSVQMYFTQDPSAVLDMETITDTNTAVNTLITTTSAGAVARRSSLVSSSSNSSVAASPTAANSTPRTSSNHGHHKSISIARPRNSVASPVSPSTNVSSSLSNQQHHHHHYNLLHAASPKNFFNKEFETRHQSFSVPAKSKAISSASKHGRCMSKSIAEVAMASTSSATPATKPLPLPASTFSSFAFQGSSSSIGHGLGIQAFGGDSSTIEEAPTTVAATTSSVVTNGNSESNFSTSTVASSIVSTISPNNSPSMSRPRQQSVSFSTSGTFNDDYQVSQVPIKFNDDSDFNEEDDDEEEEDDDDEESNIEDGFDIINHHNYVNRVSPPAMGFPVTPPHSGTSPEFKSSFGYNNNSQPSEIINPGPRRHSIFTPSYNDQTQYMARHENLYNVSTPKTPKQVKFKGHDDDDEDDHNNNNNNNIVTTPNHRRRQSVFTTNTLSETHNHHHHHHDDYDTASSSSQRSSLQDSHDSSATSTDDEIVGATTTFHKKEEQQEEESEEEKHLVVTPISPRNSLPENLRKLVSMNHAPFASIPQDQKLLLFGLYLQGCYGDFPGWRRVPTAHWKTHFVAGKVDAIAVNAEKWWKENQGMNPDVALNRFKSQLLAYV